ncbi:SDR family oxidoreductase [Caenibacillus caldisaponilyticus]|uniref:SDR family oxidoreductase n=1 Tax=Caenibacillus caldisaponilyticus TaxID=1674942 RepID=UPI001177B30C|nr:SDR family oxidoreductase [Caenibacillus caldisaponilyticus]
MVTNWLNLDDKVAVVTGAASGIGSYIAREFSRNGANVVVADMKVETRFAEDGIYHCHCDITKREDVDMLIRQTLETFGKLDILVNNAGINLPRLLVDYRGERPEYELNEKDFDLMIAVNVKGTFLCAQAAAREMIKRKQGVIINISSECGQEGSVGQSCYAATKAAIMGFTRSWGKELGNFGIRVVGIAPGIVEKTNLRSDAYNEALAYTRNTTVEGLNTNYVKSIPLGREGKLDEIAYLAAFLASDRASYITGTTINISGGKSRG